MIEVAEMAHRRREIGGPDEQRIDAGNRGDRRQVLHRGRGLDLHDHADLGGSRFLVIRDVAPAAAAMHGGDAADAVGRITRVRDRALRLLGVLHERDEQRLRAGIEQALDQHHVVPRRPHDRGRRRPRHRAQHVGDLRRVDRRVLGVDDEKIEAGAAERFGGPARR